MEVILLENMENLGSRGQIVNVANGYGRNFLLPQKMAVVATPQNRKWVEQQRVRFLKLEAKERGESEDLAKLMEGLQVVATRKAGEKGQLFGSVTTMDIEEGLAAQGFKIDRRKIQLSSPLKVVGEFDVPVKLHKDVTVIVKVRVEAEGGLEAAPEAEAPAESAVAAAAETQAEPESSATAEAEAGPESDDAASQA
ncbi:MAG TPA: 50S ribosomal protein L9 [Terriglobia bacterium]|nr:50S ribosomal protein L9 [Terriglobia bacterium]HVB28912.1 50S ribosomal protein L9 [Terriglobia bacterium]